ncbi:MAG: hypothetical protein ACE15F_01625 [bacterium]
MMKRMAGTILLAATVLSLSAWPGDSSPLFIQAERNAWPAQEALRHCYRYLYGWLAHRDPASGLIPRNLTRSRFWNAQDSAADNYPFMVLAASLLDRDLYQSTLRQMLQAEIRLTNRLDNLPDDFDFATQKFANPEIGLPRLIFGGSEYMKDGLMPLTEWLGPTEWTGRMIGIMDSVWKHAPVDTPRGKLPAGDHEVNGDQLQTLCRLYWMTGDERYQEWAFRIADYFLLDRHPADEEKLSLDDHGCEIIGGLSEAYVLAAYKDTARRESYRAPIHRLLDRILEVAANEDGLFHMQINPRTGTVVTGELTDNWGYDYNAILTVAQLDTEPRYAEAVRRVLESIHKYLDYPWENRGADGYADSVEGGINLLNRVPVDSGFAWVDQSMKILLAKQRPDGIIEGWHGDGNFTRTALMYALWKSQGASAHPWRADLALGGARDNEGVVLSLTGDWQWSGVVKFDIPRHRIYFHLPLDYPRINQFPEWFTVDPDISYRVTMGAQDPATIKGSELRNGIPVQIEAGLPLIIRVSPGE